MCTLCKYHVNYVQINVFKFLLLIHLVSLVVEMKTSNFESCIYLHLQLARVYVMCVCGMLGLYRLLEQKGP